VKDHNHQGRDAAQAVQDDVVTLRGRNRGCGGCG
jgi:hypothetical protein